MTGEFSKGAFRFMFLCRYITFHHNFRFCRIIDRHGASLYKAERLAQDGTGYIIFVSVEAGS